MNFTVTGLTVETNGMTEEQLEAAKIFSGKNAGICYMGDSYFDSSVTDPDKALKRFVGTANNGHHSIADHVRIEVLFECASKMLAIVLNSLQDYATSEKSGRYTIMTGNSERECELYNKWKDIFEKRILELYPSFNDAMLNKKFDKKYPDSGKKVIDGRLLEFEPKLDVVKDRESFRYFHEVLLNDETLPSKKTAQENARYVLSVFTYSTTFGYSTSIRQWNYIYDWCMKYCNQYYTNPDKEYIKVMSGGNGDVTLMRKKDNSEVSFFESRLYYDLLTLANYIRDTMYIPELRDNKNRCFEFLTSYSGVDNHPMTKYDLSCFESNGYTGEYDYSESTHSKDDKLDITYNVSYTASFVHIAQAERHRTLKYFIRCNFSNTDNLDFFIPPMLIGTPYADEWIKDLESVSDIIPQATKVGVIETGHISDFILKCEERLCGRAQWEIMNQTKLTAKRFIDAVVNGDIQNEACIDYVKKFSDIKVGYLKTKCEMLGKCSEGCFFGANQALHRLV